jgi:hypothetical protein
MKRAAASLPAIFDTGPLRGCTRDVSPAELRARWSDHLFDRRIATRNHNIHGASPYSFGKGSRGQLASPDCEPPAGYKPRSARRLVDQGALAGAAALAIEKRPIAERDRRSEMLMFSPKIFSPETAGGNSAHAARWR